MAKVIVNSFLAEHIGEKAPADNSELMIPADDVRQLIRSLEHIFPSLAGKLTHGIAVAVDGEIHQDALLMDLGEDSEVFFIPAIEGG
ncbi:hypothetical protein [Aurantivibrio plasticivorans]